MADLGAQVAVRLSGGSGLDPDAAREFAEGFYAAVAELGVSTQSDPFDADLAPFGAAGRYAVDQREADKSGGVLTVALVVSVFIGTELGSWAVARSANTVWDRVSPALGRLFSRLRRHKAAAPDARVVLRTVYGVDQVVVELEAPVGALDEGDLGRLLAQAHEFARKAVDDTKDNPKGTTVVRCRANGNNVDGEVEILE